MFEWLANLAKRRTKSNKNEFDRAYDITIAFAKDVKIEFDKIKSDENLSREAVRIMNQFYSNKFLADSCALILSKKQAGEFKEAYKMLFAIANMFVIMADYAFPNSSLVPRSTAKVSFANPGWGSFENWCRSLKPEMRNDILLFAYMATVLEQTKSGGASPIAYDFRLIIVALAASASADDAEKQIANEIYKLIALSKSSRR